MKHVIIDNDLPDGVENFEGHIAPDRKLHLIVADDVQVVNSIYEAKWDGEAKNLTVLKGDPATLTARYLGWPES